MISMVEAYCKPLAGRAGAGQEKSLSKWRDVETRGQRSIPSGLGDMKMGRWLFEDV